MVGFGEAWETFAARGEDFLNRTDAQDTERKESLSATVLETDEATGGVCCSLRYLF